MIVLDTNVVSEAMKPAPLRSPTVFRWLALQPTDLVYVTALTVAEISAGLETLPNGRKKADLKQAAERMFEEVFAGRVLGFDHAAARVYGVIVAARRRAGLALATIDGQIAAITRIRGMTIATRDEQDFAECGVPIVNPWIES